MCQIVVIFRLFVYNGGVYKTVLIFFIAFLIPVGAKAYDKNYIFNYLTKDKILTKPYVENFLSKVKLNKRQITTLFKNSKDKEYWYMYKTIFINQKHIKFGRMFLKKHKRLLDEVEKKFGVNRYIITAIIGMETFYGRYKPKFSVADSLYTLSVVSKRDKYFLGELKYFLVYAKKNNIDPFSVKGSYAGSIGMPQFMPYNILYYGVDFNHDNKVDLENSVSDVVASVANFLAKHGWRKNEPVMVKIKKICKIDSKTISLNAIRDCLVKSVNVKDETVKIATLKEKNGYSQWACFHNCSVLMRYHASYNYILSATILSEMLKDK